MEEQLQLIQSLRQEVRNLTVLRDRAREIYYSKDKEANNLRKYNNSLQKQLNDKEKHFKDKINNKFQIFSFYTYIILAILISLVCNFAFDFPAFSSFLLGCSFGFFADIPFIKYFASNRFVHYLVKKYPDIKNIENDITDLKSKININYKTLQEFEKNCDLSQLESMFNNSEEVLNRKKEELEQLVKEYFDNLIGKPIIIDEPQQVTFGIESHGKRKIRRPNKNENLTN